MTVLAGAFGVGLGFGMQSIVNNFVSGLILLFERPIHVGDIIEVGDLVGEVSRIGIRASIVRTYLGAEMIVPNAQLATERVINWTLSDRRRRIDLAVGVDYGSAPDKVVEVLESVARSHPSILKDPVPQAVFIKFDDSSIDFELRAWTNQFERWPKIKTELAAGVYAALHAAGMSLPFPQREVRVLHDGLGARANHRRPRRNHAGQDGTVVESAHEVLEPPALSTLRRLRARVGRADPVGRSLRHGRPPDPRARSAPARSAALPRSRSPCGTARTRARRSSPAAPLAPHVTLWDEPVAFGDLDGQPGDEVVVLVEHEHGRQRQLRLRRRVRAA